MISLGIADVVNRPNPIKLPNGAVIVLGEWRLDADCAEALHRPNGSMERNLRIFRPDKSESTTNPSSSWYLAKQGYAELMELIRAGKLSFNDAKRIVDGIRSNTDAQAANEYMAQYRH